MGACGRVRLERNDLGSLRQLQKRQLRCLSDGGPQRENHRARVGRRRNRALRIAGDRGGRRRRPRLGRLGSRRRQLGQGHRLQHPRPAARRASRRRSRGAHRSLRQRTPAISRRTASKRFFGRRRQAEVDLPAARLQRQGRQRPRGRQATASRNPPRSRHPRLLGIPADALRGRQMARGSALSAQLRTFEHPHRRGERRRRQHLVRLADRQPHDGLRAPPDSGRSVGRPARTARRSPGAGTDGFRQRGSRSQSLAPERSGRPRRHPRLPHHGSRPPGANRPRRLSPPYRIELGRRRRIRRLIAGFLPLHDRRRGHGFRGVHRSPGRRLRLLVVVLAEDDRHAPLAGAYTSVFGYERSAHQPDGHRNIFFADARAKSSRSTCATMRATRWARTR